MAFVQIPDTMQAIQVVEYGKPYQINTVPVPKTLEPNELLIKVAVASFCHTDMMVQNGVFGGTKLPITASHEGAGTVVAVGSAVAADGAFHVGNRVMGGIPHTVCGACADCTGPETQRQYCTGGCDGHNGVYGTDGYFAEYACVDAAWSTRLPDTVSFLSAAPLSCAGRTVWRAVQQAILRTEMKEGDWLAIVGAGGGLGHMGVQFAKKHGLRVVGIDARDEGLDAAHQAGADLVVDARNGKEACVDKVHKATSGGAAATLVLADVPTASALACAVTRSHGSVVQIAQPDTVVVPFREIVFRDVRIYGSLVCSPQESRDMIDFVAKYGLDIEVVSFDGLDKIEDLQTLVHSGKIKGKAAIVVDAKQIGQGDKLKT